MTRRIAGGLMMAMVAAVTFEAGAAAQVGTESGAALPANAVTVAGCVARQAGAPDAPAVGHENAGAEGLMLSQATRATAATRSGDPAPASAVPGSTPSGTGTGTIPRSPAGVAPAASDVTAYWIAGARGSELSRYIGRMVRVVGVIEEPPQAQSGRATGTSGDRAAVPSADGARSGAGDTRANAPGTRAEATPPATAHPSAPQQTLTLQAFQVLDGKCR